MAFFAISHPANEYRAMGIDALDCDGLEQTYLFAVPALLIYGSGFLVQLRRWRSRWRLVAAMGCLLVCALVAINTAKVVAAQSEQSADCHSR